MKYLVFVLLISSVEAESVIDSFKKSISQKYQFSQSKIIICDIFSCQKAVQYDFVRGRDCVQWTTLKSKNITCGNFTIKELYDN